MKLFLLSDNIDTYLGMRLAGIEGKVLHERDEVEQAVREAVDDPTVGILLITEKLADLCPDLIQSIKLGQKRMLVTEVPDRHGGSRAAGALERYVSEAIGVKM
ncbi:V-type ATP synthase subunit F [Clostridiaceae bacterium NSJ-31]|uniref:V-type ATP synthase subunit F n=1 Tax=Ligaoa zhengdingensis TaxID=2763658 RepID=A0A926DVR8_9FIRM|nr:V-type ATP synthase subunit F [Ligaoa zhengdingensis]MBC8545611.1 V-type ATP synthase subunit F [Ligaoa zhengdingensis]